MRVMSTFSQATASVTLAMLAATGSLAASDAIIVGPRALGMGGAGVAATDDQNAQFYNPAAFGFMGRRDPDGARLRADGNDLGRKHWGAGVDLTLGLTAHGDLIAIADQLSKIDYQRLGNQGVQNQNDVNQAVSFANALAKIDDPGMAISAEATAGLSVRVGHWALGVRSSFDAAGKVLNTDVVNVGIGVGGLTLARQINDNGGPSDGTISALSTAQRDSLYQNLGGTGAFNPTSDAGRAVARIDYEARQQGLTPAEIAEVFPIINTAVQGSSGTLENNSTTLVLNGFGVTEIPLSYGHALNDWISVGGSAKLLLGRVYGTTVLVFKDGAIDTLKNTKDNYKKSINVGFDVSVLARSRWVQGGLTIRNLNSPSFKGFSKNGVTYPGVRLKPSATLGVALTPFTTFTVAADLALLAEETAYAGYQQQRAGVGAEWNPWRIIALRAGVSRNLAEKDIPMLLHAGLGLNLWALRIDLAAAATTKTQTVDGTKIPTEARFSFGVMSDF